MDVLGISLSVLCVALTQLGVYGWLGWGSKAEVERQRKSGVDAQAVAMLDTEHQIVGRIASALIEAARTVHEEGMAFNQRRQFQEDGATNNLPFEVDPWTKSALKSRREPQWDVEFEAEVPAGDDILQLALQSEQVARERVEDDDREQEDTVSREAERVHDYWLARNKKDWLARNGWPIGKQPPASKVAGVYFIENAAGHVKVGRAKDPAKRLNELQTGNSELLTLAHVAWFATAKEAKHCESALHVHLHSQGLHLRGEWFMKPTRDYADLVDKTEGIAQALKMNDCTFSPPVRRWPPIS